MRTYFCEVDSDKYAWQVTIRSVDTDKIVAIKRFVHSASAHCWANIAEKAHKISNIDGFIVFYL